MLDEKRFIEEMWKKYRKYSKNTKLQKEFFNEKIFKNNVFSLSAKNFVLCLSVLIISGLLATGVYATIKSTFEPKVQFVQEEGYVETLEDFGVSKATEENMTYLEKEGVFYKKINSYDEYMELKNKYKNLIEIEKEEFDKYFLLIILVNPIDYMREGMNISKLNILEDRIYIEIKKDYNKKNEILFTKIEKENEREKIEIKLQGEIPQMSNYIAMKDLPENYSKEQAIKDNCVVIEGANGKYVSRPEALKEFIKKTENGINDNIRVVEYYTNEGFGYSIIDIEYRDGKYIVCADQSHYHSGFTHIDYRYIITDKIEFTENTEGRNIKETYIMTEVNEGRIGEQVFINIWF